MWVVDGASVIVAGCAVAVVRCGGVSSRQCATARLLSLVRVSSTPGCWESPSHKRGCFNLLSSTLFSPLHLSTRGQVIGAVTLTKRPLEKYVASRGGSCPHFMFTFISGRRHNSTSSPRPKPSTIKKMEIKKEWTRRSRFLCARCVFYRNDVMLLYISKALNTCVCVPAFVCLFDRFESAPERCGYCGCCCCCCCCCFSCYVSQAEGAVFVFIYLLLGKWHPDSGFRFGEKSFFFLLHHHHSGGWGGC